MSLTRSSFALAATAIGGLALSACASTDYHYSQLYGYRYHRAPIDTYAVTIVRVDGKGFTKCALQLLKWPTTTKRQRPRQSRKADVVVARRRFSEAHGFAKPNDDLALRLMNAAAQARHAACVCAACDG